MEGCTIGAENVLFIKLFNLIAQNRVPDGYSVAFALYADIDPHTEILPNGLI